jgi:hypothetical protein
MDAVRVSSAVVDDDGEDEDDDAVAGVEAREIDDDDDDDDVDDDATAADLTGDVGKSSSCDAESSVNNLSALAGALASFLSRMSAPSLDFASASSSCSIRARCGWSVQGQSSRQMDIEKWL